MLLLTLIIRGSTTDFEAPRGQVVHVFPFAQSKVSYKKLMGRGDTGALTLSDEHYQIALGIGHHLR